MATLSVSIPWPRSWDRLFAVDPPEAAAPGVASDPDGDWVQRARRGDTVAFRVLVDRYRHQVLEVALRILRNPEEAEEAAQDAFVRAWKGLDGFRGDARFSTWIYRIATRCALDALRRNQRRKRHETGVDSETLESLAGSKATVPDGRRLRLERILGDLDPVPRTVVTLFYLRDLSVEEIGTILELPAGTVKTHLHRSRAVLRRAWMRHEVTHGLRNG